MEAVKVLKKRGRKAKKQKDKVVSKPVYLIAKDWDYIIKEYGTPTKAMKELLENE